MNQLLSTTCPSKYRSNDSVEFPWDLDCLELNDPFASLEQVLHIEECSKLRVTDPSFVDHFAILCALGKVPVQYAKCKLELDCFDWLIPLLKSTSFNCIVLRVNDLDSTSTSDCC